METADIKLALLFFIMGYVSAYIGLILTMVMCLSYIGTLYAEEKNIDIYSETRKFMGLSNKTLHVNNLVEQEKKKS